MASLPIAALLADQRHPSHHLVTREAKQRCTGSTPEAGTMGNRQCGCIGAPEPSPTPATKAKGGQPGAEEGVPPASANGTKPTPAPPTSVRWSSKEAEAEAAAAAAAKAAEAEAAEKAAAAKEAEKAAGAAEEARLEAEKVALAAAAAAEEEERRIRTAQAEAAKKAAREKAAREEEARKAAAELARSRREEEAASAEEAHANLLIHVHRDHLEPAEPGQLSVEQLRAKKKFDELDAEGNGLLSKEEVHGMATDLFSSFHPEVAIPERVIQRGEAKVEADIMALDTNMDGQVSFEEFSTWYSKNAEDIVKKRHAEAMEEAKIAAQKEHDEELAAAAAAREKAEEAAAAEEKRAKLEAEEAAARAKEEAQARAEAEAKAEELRVQAQAALAAAAAEKKAREAAEAAHQAEMEALAKKNWFKVALPDIDPATPVVRKEIRSMTEAEQTRYADAIDKMMESYDGEHGSSQYFRLASIHGGPKYETSQHANPVGVYCVHGFEAFPGWHRAYLLDFERTLRLADMANGGDGTIGLPYWGWEEEEINGQVFPEILRKRCNKYPEDFFPAKSEGRRTAQLGGDTSLVVPSEDRIRRAIQGKGAQAAETLNSDQHWQVWPEHGSLSFLSTGPSACKLMAV
jgi:hypothetical protein